MDRLAAILALCAVTAAVAPAEAQDSAAGLWHVTPGGIGAGYADHFALFDDGRWEFGDQYVCADDDAANGETVRARSGTWVETGGVVALHETARTVIRGGRCTCDAIACDIEGGVTHSEAMDAVIDIDPAADCLSEYDPMEMIGVALPCLTIEGTGYFRLGPAEDLLP